MNSSAWYPIIFLVSMGIVAMFSMTVSSRAKSGSRAMRPGIEDAAVVVVGAAVVVVVVGTVYWIIK